MCPCDNLRAIESNAYSMCATPVFYTSAVEKVPSSPSDTENSKIWIIIGVVIPLLVAIVIIAILYWKLCRSDKLEFQPDAMTSIQQRQKVDTAELIWNHVFILFTYFNLFQIVLLRYRLLQSMKEKIAVREAYIQQGF